MLVPQKSLQFEWKKVKLLRLECSDFSIPIKFQPKSRFAHINQMPVLKLPQPLPRFGDQVLFQ